MLAEVKTLWDFHRVNDPIKTSDVVVAMGCKEPAVAQKAAQLLLEGKAGLMVCTGSKSPLTKDLPATEAEFLQEVALSCGVPQSRLVTEPNATNTKENIVNTLALPSLKNFWYRRVIWVHFPEMGLRVRQTVRKQSVGRDLTHYITHPDGLLCSGDAWQVNLLMGNIDRLVKYGKVGDLEETPIPDPVWDAYHSLRELGYGQEVPENPHDFHWKAMI